MASSNGSSRFLRHILRQVSQNVANNQRQKIRSQQLIKYYKSAVQKNQDREVDSLKEELKDKITTFVRNEKLWAEVHKQYYSSKEISVEETAKNVGVKIPHDPYFHEPICQAWSDRLRLNDNMKDETSD